MGRCHHNLLSHQIHHYHYRQSDLNQNHHSLGRFHHWLSQERLDKSKNHYHHNLLFHQIRHHHYR